MREILGTANQDLLHQIRVLRELIDEARVPDELTPYVRQVQALCEDLRQRAQLNLADLEDDLRDTFVDILNDTQVITTGFELVNSILALPIVRSRHEDRLALGVLKWLHEGHQATEAIPFGFTDRGFAVYPPRAPFPPVYFLPVSRQRTLLYLPLLFHEFGHVLYVCHEDELGSPIERFQQSVASTLAPVTVRPGGPSRREASFRQALVNAWFLWLLELFCDAVGITIGGPCFLLAFSSYFCARSSEHYYLPRGTQLQREHPVTWIRTKMLVDRARKLGFVSLAADVEQSWQAIAETMGIQEDYQGTWSEEFFLPLRQTLDEMLQVAQPRHCTREDIDVPAGTELDSPVRLLNVAWDRFGCEPGSYAQWEKGQIERLIRGPHPGDTRQDD